MTRRGFMGRLAVAAGVSAILPILKTTMPMGDAIVAGVDIGAKHTWNVMEGWKDESVWLTTNTISIDENMVAKMEDTFVEVKT